jgi:hypothetical protein
LLIVVSNAGSLAQHRVAFLYGRLVHFAEVQPKYCSAGIGTKLPCDETIADGCF